MTNPSAKPERTLSLFDAICVIVGTIIGAGVFKSAPDVAAFAGSTTMMMLLWTAGGLLTIAGALCFAELTTSHPNLLGGDYGYLKLAYGNAVAFLFAWATFWIVRPGNIGAMAITFAAYFATLWPSEAYADNGGANWQVVYAIAAVVMLCGLNLLGLRQGRIAQNMLTVAKVLGIAAIVAMAFLFGSETADPIANKPADDTSATAKANWLLAMVFVMFSFGGWNDLSFIAAEIRSPAKNLFRSLIYGSLAVTIVYLVLNAAFAFALGHDSMAQSNAVATDVVRATMGTDSIVGRNASRIVAALICVSCLGAINGIIITSPRIYYAAGQDFRIARIFGRWDSQRHQPWMASVFQALVTIAMFVLCFQYEKPFEVIVVVSAPFFWTFLGLAGLSLIVLRRNTPSSSTANEAAAEPVTPFRVPLYPLEPIVLAAACAAMTWSSIQHIVGSGYGSAAIAVCALLGLGGVLGLIEAIRFADRQVGG